MSQTDCQESLEKARMKLEALRDDRDRLLAYWQALETKAAVLLGALMVILGFVINAWPDTCTPYVYSYLIASLALIAYIFITVIRPQYPEWLPLAEWIAKEIERKPIPQVVDDLLDHYSTKTRCQLKDICVQKSKGLIRGFWCSLAIIAIGFALILLVN